MFHRCQRRERHSPRRRGAVVSQGERQLVAKHGESLDRSIDISGTWYTLRMETVGDSLRMFLNGTLMATATGVGPPVGQIALATYKASADFDDFLAYQP